jgi:ATP-dependent Zn protease
MDKESRLCPSTAKTIDLSQGIPSRNSAGACCSGSAFYPDQHNISTAPPYTRKPYSDFIPQVESDQVSNVEIGSSRILYTLKSHSKSGNASASSNLTIQQTIPLPNDPELPKLLKANQVEITAIASEVKSPSVLPWQCLFVSLRQQSDLIIYQD